MAISEWLTTAGDSDDHGSTENKQKPIRKDPTYEAESLRTGQLEAFAPSVLCSLSIQAKK